MSNEKKYRIEKDLHKLINEMPDIRKMSDAYDRGLLDTEQALGHIYGLLVTERHRKESYHA